MKPPTKRQRYLLEWVSMGLVTVSVWPKSQSWKLIRGHSFYRLGSERTPAEREGKRLIELGWVKLVVDPAHWTEDTLTGNRTFHYRAALTELGQAVVKNVPRG